MIPDQIKFTGLTVPALDLLYGYGGRKANYIPPAHWVRVEFPVVAQTGRVLDQVDSWLAKNINGKWVSKEFRHGSAIVVFFEDDNDALIFKLMEGETASMSELQTQ
jgi:hypothetical protein